MSFQSNLAIERLLEMQTRAPLLCLCACATCVVVVIDSESPGTRPAASSRIERFNNNEAARWDSAS